jgi:hypothetical protein
MPTLGDALGALEEELFVGREREVAAFRAWLAAEPTPPRILGISGRGGVGKSALLRAFGREAQRLGRPVSLLDSRDFPHTAAGFLAALGAPDGVDPLAHLNATRPLLLLDTFEELGELTRYFQDEFLPRLDAVVKVVVAGRYTLGQEGRGDSRWRRLVQPLPLEALSAAASREYLRRRGLLDLSLAEQILGAVGGNPLALALAADLALELGTRGFTAAGEWRLVVRGLVERLLADVQDPALRELLDACAVVRQFDEDLLAALTAREDIGGPFAQLCRLAIVRPAEHGLMLHDDVRRALADDLRWRRPERYNVLRVRALAHYRERARGAGPGERDWLVAERLYLSENAFVQAVLFGADEELEPLWLESGRPEDHPDVVRIQMYYLGHVAPRELNVQAPFDPGILAAVREYTEALLRYPGTRLRIARDGEGQAIGVTVVLPVCQESLPLVLGHPVLAPLVHAYWQPEPRAALPARAEATNAYYFLFGAYTDLKSASARAAILRDWFSLFALGGVYLFNAPVSSPGNPVPAGVWADVARMLEVCGFERVEGARGQAIHPTDGYVLDLTRIGFETWLEAIVRGRRPAPPLSPAEVEQELQAVLTRWNDDARLAASPLLRHPPLAAVLGPTPDPAALRQAVRAALARARAGAPASREQAYRALELAYLAKTTSHERAAERLGVSPTTFYRLLKRGVRGLAAALATPAAGGEGV